MTTVNAPSTPAPAPAGNALPLMSGRLSFVVHAVLAVAMLAWMNQLIATHAPFGVKQIGASYLVAYYHVPAATFMTVAYTMVCVAGVFFLVTKSTDWDRRARAFAAVGLLSNGVVLLTGMVWGKAAWNVWWNSQDPRLTISAVMFLIYLAYTVLARGIEDDLKRPRICAIYGIIAALSLPLVKYSVEWFGQGSHPPKVDMKDEAIQDTLGAGMLAFLVFYLLLYRWKYDLDTLRDRADAALNRVRRLEETRS